LWEEEKNKINNLKMTKNLIMISKEEFKTKVRAILEL
jgi:hypothetical protein